MAIGTTANMIRILPSCKVWTRGLSNLTPQAKAIHPFIPPSSRPFLGGLPYHFTGSRQVSDRSGKKPDPTLRIVLPYGAGLNIHVSSAPSGPLKFITVRPVPRPSLPPSSVPLISTSTKQANGLSTEEQKTVIQQIRVGLSHWMKGAAESFLRELYNVLGEESHRDCTASKNLASREAAAEKAIMEAVGKLDFQTLEALHKVLPLLNKPLTTDSMNIILRFAFKIEHALSPEGGQGFEVFQTIMSSYLKALVVDEGSTYISPKVQQMIEQSAVRSTVFVVHSIADILANTRALAASMDSFLRYRG